MPTIVSLNTVMIDGTGMCGGCRVVLEDGAQFVCVDGPEFDGHKVDWNNLLSRLAFYRDEEQAGGRALAARVQSGPGRCRGGGLMAQLDQ